MRSTYRFRLSRTLPNLPLVEEDVESLDSTDGGAPLHPPAPPPPSPSPSHRNHEEVRNNVSRRHNHGDSQSSVSSGATLVATGSSPLRNGMIDHQDSNQREQLIAQMATALDPTIASFEPSSACVQLNNQFGGASQLSYNHNSNGAPMTFAENGVVSGMQQLQQQPVGDIIFAASQPQIMHTFQAQLPTANMPQRDQSLMPTFQDGPVYQSQQIYQPLSGQNQNGFNMPPESFVMQTPHGGGEGSTGRFTPATYRFTPQSSNASPGLQSFASSTTRFPPSTEPRSFAPRTSGLVPHEPPPRFVLQTPGPVSTPAPLHNQMHSENGSTNSLQHGGCQHTFPSNQTITGDSGNDGHDFDPFRTIELPSVIQPIEPISNALAARNHPVPEYLRNQRSKQLNILTAGPNALPSIEMALHPDNFPFIEGPRNAQPPPNWGVVKIKNIPFSARRAEIIAFLGRNSRVLNDRQEPVHIIMERVTSKTNDCYVEFMSMQDAVHAVEKHNKAISSGRQNRLGDRPVELELSSQAALMKDLFPHANGVRWEGARPVILENHPTEPWSCFKGFITEEEMTCLVKHVEVPQRSPFSRDCPQRPYECMISTLRKLPWYMAGHITIRQRHAVYKAVMSLICRLQTDLQSRKFEEYLNDQLYKRLWTSAMLCDGLTVTMKDDVAYLVGLSDERMREFNMPRFSNFWVHQYTMAPKPGTPLDVIEWYIAIIREETERRLSMSLPNVQAAIRKEGEDTVLYWGYFFKELDLPQGPSFDNMTLAEMATREFTAVTDILRRALAQ